MRTLLIDSSGPCSTVALVEGGVLAGHTSIRAQPLRHLHDQILDLLRQLALEVEAVERVAVVTGPGSWTGLNIGVTAAKTLAQVLVAPVVELSALDALVAARRWRGGPVFALLDAKRSNVYCGIYPTGELGEVEVAAGWSGAMPFAELAAKLGEEGVPLVVEYGDAYREELAKIPRPMAVAQRDCLSPEGLLAALQAHPGEALSGRAAQELAPRYMQRLLPKERQKAPGS